jgi:hypothetical protein
VRESILNGSDVRQLGVYWVIARSSIDILLNHQKAIFLDKTESFDIYCCQAA